MISSNGNAGRPSAAFRALLCAGLLLGSSATLRAQIEPDTGRRLLPDEPIATGPLGDGYGHRVALDRNTAVVSAWARPVVDTESTYVTGLLFVFERNSRGAWQQQARLTYEPRGPWSGNFAREVAIDGRTLIATAFSYPSSEVHVFEKSTAGIWERRTILQGSAAVPALHAEWYGSAIAVSGDTIAVASGGYDGSQRSRPPVSGPVLMYARNPAGQWQLQAKIRAADQWSGDGFGWNAGYWNGSALALVGNTLFVGAPRARDAAGKVSGAVYVFRRGPSGAWVQQAKIVAPVGGSEFGTAVSAGRSPGTVLIGAPAEPGGGAAYLYSRQPNGSWARRARLLPEETTGQFGSRLALDGRKALVATEFGEAHVFVEQDDGAWLQEARFEDAESAEALIYASPAMHYGTALVGFVASDQVLVHDLPPAALALRAVAKDNCINALEARAPVSVHGSRAEPGATVTVTLAGQTRTTEGREGSAWTVAFSAAEVAAMPEGELTLTVSQRDLPGGLSPASSVVVCKDTAVPARPAIAAVATDDVVSAAERRHGLTLRGSAEPGSAVSVSLGGFTAAATADRSGAWALELSPRVSAALPAGALTVEAVSRDRAGNASSSRRAIRAL